MGKREAGFTIIELLVGMTVLGLIFSGIVMLFSTSLTSLQIGRSKIEVAQTLRVGMDNIAREARGAKTASVAQSGAFGSLTLTNSADEKVTFAVNQTTKALVKQVITTGGTTAGLQPVAGDGTGNNEGQIVIAGLAFSRDDKLISIVLTARDKKTGVQLTMQTKIFCMNI